MTHFRDPYIEDSLSEEEYQKIFPSTHVDLMKMCDDMYTGRTLLVKFLIQTFQSKDPLGIQYFKKGGLFAVKLDIDCYEDGLEISQDTRHTKGLATALR